MTHFDDNAYPYLAQRKPKGYTERKDGSRWLSRGIWAIEYWPQAGGSQGHVFVDGIGWCMDSRDEMPPDVWAELLEAVGAPTC